MRILAQYLVKEHAAPFVFSLAALTGFMLLNQIARRLEQLVGKDLPWTVIAEFFLLTIPHLVTLTISMSVLVAVLHTFSRLSRDSEITAFRAGGISLVQLVRPVLIAASLVGLVAFLFGDQVLPRTNHRLSMLWRAIARTKPAFSLKEHVINEIPPGRVFLRTARINRATYMMRDVAIYRFVDRNTVTTVYADSGRITYAPNQEDLQLILFSGTAHEFDRRDPGNFQRTMYDKYLIALPGVGDEFFLPEGEEFYTDREMSTCVLEDRAREARRRQWRAQRAVEAAQRNGLRDLVGLPPVQPDTVAPSYRRSLYCRVLDWIIPADLEAQETPRITPLSDSAMAAARSRMRAANQQHIIRSRSPRARMNEIRTHLDLERAERQGTARFMVEFHKKYAIPAACIVFVFVGVPVALRFPGGLGMVIGVALAIFGVYYVGLIAGETLADGLIVPAFWAMWAPNIVFGTVGGFALWRTSRQGVSAPGQ
jgi:lipopolysaccharide export system permease protein